MGEISRRRPRAEDMDKFAEDQAEALEDEFTQSIVAEDV
jgi:hypothetical protein